MKMNHPLRITPASSIRCRLLLTLLAGSSTALSQTATIQNIVSPGTPFSVTALNINGQVSGHFFESESSQSVFIWSNGIARNLGTLGGSFSIANALNSSGTAVGFSALPLDSEFHAFRSDGVTLADLGTLGGFFSSATAISDAGHIVGDSSGSLEEAVFHAFLLNPGGSMVDLGTLGGSSSTAYGVNSSGIVIGNSTVAGDSALHGFLHNGSAMLDLGTLGGASSSAVDLNASGQVTGDSTTVNEQTHAFLFTGGVMIDLGTLGGSYSSGITLNDAGVVIGNSTTANDAETRGFVYQNGSKQDLGSLGGGSSSAKAINNRGQIVGTSGDANGQQRAFLWDNGVMTDLNLLLPANSDWELASARFINDNQQVVGEGFYQGQASWYLLSLSSGEGENHAPIADAGPDQLLMCNGSVRLDGSASSDPDNDELTYEWLNGNASLSTKAVFDTSLPAGSHTLTLRVTDTHGVASEDTVTIVVSSDVLPPSVVCPTEATAPANGRGRAVVPDFLANLIATDNCTAASALVKRQSPAPGTSVKCGIHAVTLTVADASGNVTTCSTRFTVVDVASPVVRCPEDVFRRARTNCQAAVPNLVERVNATDNCTPANQLLITQEPAVGTSVGAGVHEVRITVTDLAGNASVCTVRLVVADVVAPMVTSVNASQNVLRPADGRMVPVTLSVIATDNCDPNPLARIVAVASSQPTTGLNDTTTPDWILTGDLTVSLRAETSSFRTPRIYFVLVAVSDASGNTTFRSVWIRVPKN